MSVCSIAHPPEAMSTNERNTHRTGYEAEDHHFPSRKKAQSRCFGGGLGERHERRRVSRWMDTLDPSLRTSPLARTTSALFSSDNDCLRRRERRAQDIFQYRLCYTLHEHLPLVVRLQCGPHIWGRIGHHDAWKFVPPYQVLGPVSIPCGVTSN